MPCSVPPSPSLRMGTSFVCGNRCAGLPYQKDLDVKLHILRVSRGIGVGLMQSYDAHTPKLWQTKNAPVSSSNMKHCLGNWVAASWLAAHACSLPAASSDCCVYVEPLVHTWGPKNIGNLGTRGGVACASSHSAINQTQQLSNSSKLKLHSNRIPTGS